MDIQTRCLRAGAAALALAVVVKLGSRFGPELLDLLRRESFASVMLFLETGRTDQPLPTDTAPSTEPTAAVTEPSPTSPPATVPAFSPEDSSLVSVTALPDLAVDIPALLTAPLQWQDSPTVLILHSHATESYTPTQAEPYTASGSYRTLDEKHNMLRVGDHLQALLEQAGIRVIHDRTLHDYPDFNNAYAASRRTAQNYLAQYPTIDLVLDLHRDASDADTQLNTAATVNGKASAQLMFVIGTNGTGLTHPDWQKNLSLAVKLQATLEKAHPGICRSVNLRAERFNQDLSPGAMIVEVGAAGDTLEEALVSMEALAEAILALCPTADSAS